MFCPPFDRVSSLLCCVLRAVFRIRSYLTVCICIRKNPYMAITRYNISWKGPTFSFYIFTGLNSRSTVLLNEWSGTAFYSGVNSRSVFLQKKRIYNTAAWKAVQLSRNKTSPVLACRDYLFCDLAYTGTRKFWEGKCTIHSL